MATYMAQEPERAEIDRTRGLLLIEFGADWCGICKAAQPNIQAALGAFDEHAVLQYIKVSDGPGQPLGRSFRVKFWPTLIALRDGKEFGRVVRPTSRHEITQLLNAGLHLDPK